MISDSLQLRKQAAAALGGKLLTSLQAPVQHTRKVKGTEGEKVAVFRTAAAEMWLYSLADYHIMTTGSGFGRIGSYISGHWHQLYAVTYKKNSAEPAVNRSCSATDFEVDHSHAQNM